MKSRVVAAGRIVGPSKNCSALPLEESKMHSWSVLLWAVRKDVYDSQNKHIITKRQNDSVTWLKVKPYVPQGRSGGGVD
jgi:hypothetical protein